MERVDTGQIRVDPADPRILQVDLAELDPDLYTVTWLIISTVDGHSTSGLFTFSIGQETGENVPSGIAPPPATVPPPGAWEVGIRWPLFATATTAFGALLLVPTVLGPVRRSAEVNETVWPRIDRTLNLLIMGAILLWLLAGLAALGLQTVVAGRVSLPEALARGVPLRLLGTRFGIVLALRQLLALALLVLHWRSRQPRSDHWDWRRLVEIGLAAALLGSISLSSHGAAGALWPVLATVVDWLHLLANGAWIGGIVALTVAVAPALRRLPDDRRRAALMGLLRRFSALAIASVIVVAVSGAFSAALHVLLPADLVETAYGWTLLFKLGFVLLILLVGLANRLALRPEWSARLSLGRIWSDRWRTTLSGAVRIEALLGLLILFTTALLTALPTPPPRPLDPGRFPFNQGLRQVELPEDRLKAFVSLMPNWIGWNRYLIALQDEAGRPIANTERVRLRFYLPKVEARTDWVIAAPVQEGLYVASGQELVLVGDWQIEVDIRRSGLADARFSTEWSMAAPPTTLVDPTRPRPLNWLALAGLGLSLTGLVVWTMRRTLRFAAYLFGQNLDM